MRNLLRTILGVILAITACRLLTPAWVPTPTPGLLTHTDWLVYQDPSGFSIQHPLTWQQWGSEGYPVVFTLPATAGTNLIEKTLEINVVQNAPECRQSTYGTGGNFPAPEHVTINGIDFLKEYGGGIALGNIYETTSYSTQKDASCITITFVLHSSSSGVYSTEPPPFDRVSESAVFDEMLGTLRFGI
jgi:hypothetical protein